MLHGIRKIYWRYGEGPSAAGVHAMSVERGPGCQASRLDGEVPHCTLVSLARRLPPAVLAHSAAPAAPAPARLPAPRARGQVGRAVARAPCLWSWRRRSSLKPLLLLTIGAWLGAGGAAEEGADGDNKAAEDEKRKGCGSGGAGTGTGAGARRELHHDRYKGRSAENSATVGAKDAEDDIVPSDAEFQAG